MNYWGWVTLLSLVVAPATAANKCVETSGRIFYQDAPCPPDTHGGDLRLNVNRPFTGQAKRPAMEETLAPESDEARRQNEESARAERQPQDAQP